MQVAVGVIHDRQGRVLIGQRTARDRYQGQWEFPGGKLAQGESIEHALQRELQEELGIRVTASEPLISIAHDYPDRRVRLHVRRVTGFRGEPAGREGQDIRWMEVRDLHATDMLSGNRPIINAAWLPDRYLVSAIRHYGLGRTIATVRRQLATGQSFMLQLREKSTAKGELRQWLRQLGPVCRSAAVPLLLNGDPQLALELGADGVHLDAAALRRGPPIPRGLLLATSCHDLSELELAAAMEVDFAVLSPVASTRSHPGAPLGWRAFADLCREARVPVYALGGMKPCDLSRARDAGAQGIAMLSAAWED
jgi:8-oxo-dGTP diphosphatase